MTTDDKRLPCELDRDHARRYGFFRLSYYCPPGTDIPERAVTHEIAGDATSDQMLEAFADFLRACGYSVPGLIVEEESP